MVAIFLKLCLWRRSLCSNLGGIGLEKLYRATLMCAMEAVTFKKIILREMNFKRDTSQKRCSRNKEFLGHNVQFCKGFQRVLYQAVMVNLTSLERNFLEL